jgi:hypothetical protein
MYANAIFFFWYKVSVILLLFLVARITLPSLIWMVEANVSELHIIFVSTRD